jgi:hypothetical protein
MRPRSLPNENENIVGPVFEKSPPRLCAAGVRFFVFSESPQRTNCEFHGARSNRPMVCKLITNVTPS